MEKPHFDLFISYVRSDARVKIGRRTFDMVELFKRELEDHVRPKGLPGPTNFVVCTDIDDFELGGTFDQVMRDRIGHSTAFLLVCSPQVRASKYVMREIELFQLLKPAQPPLAAIRGASPSSILPELFSDQTVVADLTCYGDATLREVRATLRRESHKIVAQVWGIPVRQVYDRFEARHRSNRRKIATAAVAVVSSIVGIVLWLGGEIGYHRVKELIPPAKLVSPAGVGFTTASAPVVIRDRAAYVWQDPASPPKTLDLSIYALRALQYSPGHMLVADVNEFAIVDLSSGSSSSQHVFEGEISGIASWKGSAAVSNKDGTVLILSPDGTVAEGPRPTSQTGRRFPAFRETGPFRYGEQLALNDHYLASATLTGQLGILDRTTGSFVVANTPQFPLAEPVERSEDPVLYETENTRPISTVAFLPDGDLMFAEGAGLRRINPRSGRISFLSHCDIELVRQIIPLPRTNRLIALTTSTLEELEIDQRDRSKVRCIRRSTLAPKSAPRAALSDDGQTLLVAYFDAAPDLWQPTYSLFGLQVRIPSWLW
ncbi:toll/interleukin-1 receptor domain-containing protein [Bradyrhizobium sp. Bra78]|uniref:toll/interleukin-1 receptor domain-containing protein n=1 Tax=Bradyrhizobium sp. Bra78 TaxID=2926010 RepID=UPI0021C57B77|nr:toll/interleukin-1 receptor domain-containing protein [Bradyrhizobium sp. Bra78]